MGLCRTSGRDCLGVEIEKREFVALVIDSLKCRIQAKVVLNVPIDIRVGATSVVKGYTKGTTPQNYQES